MLGKRRFAACSPACRVKSSCTYFLPIFEPIASLPALENLRSPFCIHALGDRRFVSCTCLLIYSLQRWPRYRKPNIGNGAALQPSARGLPHRLRLRPASGISEGEASKNCSSAVASSYTIDPHSVPLVDRIICCFAACEDTVLCRSRTNPQSWARPAWKTSLTEPSRCSESMCYSATSTSKAREIDF